MTIAYSLPIMIGLAEFVRAHKACLPAKSKPIAFDKLLAYYAGWHEATEQKGKHHTRITHALRAYVYHTSSITSDDISIAISLSIELIVAMIMAVRQ
jgi:hypothetical protein